MSEETVGEEMRTILLRGLAFLVVGMGLLVAPPTVAMYLT